MISHHRNFSCCLLAVCLALAAAALLTFKASGSPVAVNLVDEYKSCEFVGIVEIQNKQDLETDGQPCGAKSTAKVVDAWKGGIKGAALDFFSVNLELGKKPGQRYLVFVRQIDSFEEYGEISYPASMIAALEKDGSIAPDRRVEHDNFKKVVECNQAYLGRVAADDFPVSTDDRITLETIYYRVTDDMISKLSLPADAGRQKKIPVKLKALKKYLKDAVK